MRTLFISFTLLLLIACQTKTSKSELNDPRPDLLKKLEGKWRMVGHVMGDSVEYKLNVRSVLSGVFTELHMVDIFDPPQYEALVFIGYDSTKNVIISHWLDSFGALYSIPHGTGIIDSNKIEFVVPYEERPFRDILTYYNENGEWTFLIESKSDSVNWKTFAEYKIFK